MSILERKFDGATSAEPLYAKVCARNDHGQKVPLTPQWFLIARARVIQSLARADARPNFSKNVALIAFEDIVERYCGPTKQKFNTLIRELLDFDYYQRWIASEDE